MEENEETEEKPISALDEAKLTLEAIKKEKAELKEWTERAEAVRAEQIVSGNANAGQTQEKPKEETPQEYAAKVMGGVV